MDLVTLDSIGATLNGSDVPPATTHSSLHMPVLVHRVLGCEKADFLSYCGNSDPIPDICHLFIEIFFLFYEIYCGMPGPSHVLVFFA